VKLTPVSVVWPVLAAVTVYCTTEPGAVVPLPTEASMVRPGTRSWTMAVHRGSLPPTGQLLPVVAEVTVLNRILSPVSGLFTVME
jgi:hypothetical protein